MSGIVGPRSAAARHTARRHRLYRRLLLLMLVQVVFTALPWKLHRLGMAMTAVMLLFLLSELGQLLPAGLRADGWSNRLYRLLGLAGVVALTSWLLVPATVNWHGLLLVVLIVLFVFWSLLRLLQLLREEQDVGRPVLAGAVAGYLMLGFSGGWPSACWRRCSRAASSMWCPTRRFTFHQPPCISIRSNPPGTSTSRGSTTSPS